MRSISWTLRSGSEHLVMTTGLLLIATQDYRAIADSQSRLQDYCQFLVMYRATADSKP
jgi:hypothetical protein